ncbi:acyl-CoA thioesterase [Dyella sp. ASV21]|uniref:acyl-CoA thioesterase n=1 Tax=Dyella sp. ASV21 TaxID=2795114 RepID=UPI0018EA3EF9|nr:acyl-CoA thioesterase [Dyella sp. ASV21]
MRAKGVMRVDTDLLVPFFDVDSMDVVWHGHYVKYLEVARCALLDAIGHNYTQMKAAGWVWPVIDVQLRYAAPARFGQRIIVSAELVEWRNRLKVHYVIRDAESGERLTRASTIQVAVNRQGEMQLVSPQAFIDAVERHVPDDVLRRLLPAAAAAVASPIPTIEPA